MSPLFWNKFGNIDFFKMNFRCKALQYHGVILIVVVVSNISKVCSFLPKGVHHEKAIHT